MQTRYANFSEKPWSIWRLEAKLLHCAACNGDESDTHPPTQKVRLYPSEFPRGTCRPRSVTVATDASRGGMRLRWNGWLK